MARNKRSKIPSDDRIVETLVLIALGELEVADAAQTLNLTSDELETIVSDNPALADAADTRAREIQANPERTLETSQRGLASIAATLTRRVQEAPESMTVGELTSAGSLLEKISGASEKRKLEIKSEIDPTQAEPKMAKLPVMYIDDRPNLVTKKPRLMLVMLTPDSPAWVDTTDPQFQEPHFSWLDHYLPLSADDGEPLTAAIEELASSVGFRYLDSRGRQHGGHL